MSFNINKDKIDSLFKGKDGSNNDYKEMYEDKDDLNSNNHENGEGDEE
jgi:hypothetical protein